MNYRTQKQIIIASVSAIFLLGFVFLFTFLLGGAEPPEAQKAPVSETQKPAFSDIEILFSKFFPAKDKNIFDAVAYIKNPNSEYGSPDISYEFVFYGENNIEIKKISGNAFILPARSRYIVETAINIEDALGTIPKSMDFKIKDVSWQRLSPFSPKGLTLRETELKTSPDSSTFSGIATNSTPYSLKNIEAHVVIYKGGEAISAGRTDIQDLLRGSERAFQILLPHYIPSGFEDDARIESNFFENSNFIRDYAVAP